MCKIVHTKHFIQSTLPLNVASEEHILHLCRTGAVGATAGRPLEPEGIGDVDAAAAEGRSWVTEVAGVTGLGAVEAAAGDRS